MEAVEMPSEILNISNINADGEVVLNDEKLLELIQNYPFLYNPLVQSYDDADYLEWAWETISMNFNKTYQQSENTNTTHFTVDELKQRWQVLKPICKSLSKSCDLSSIPNYLRILVMNISEKLDNDIYAVPKRLTSAQSCVLENVKLLESLPKPVQKAIEAEILEIILVAELNTKGTVNINATDIKNIDKQCDEFLKGIKFNEVYQMANEAEPELYLTKKNKINCKTHRKRFVPINEAKQHVRSLAVRIKRTNFDKYIPAHIVNKDKR